MHSALKRVEIRARYRVRIGDIYGLLKLVMTRDFGVYRKDAFARSRTKGDAREDARLRRASHRANSHQRTRFSIVANRFLGLHRPSFRKRSFWAGRNYRAGRSEGLRFTLQPTLPEVGIKRICKMSCCLCDTLTFDTPLMVSPEVLSRMLDRTVEAIPRISVRMIREKQVSFDYFVAHLLTPLLYMHYGTSSLRLGDCVQNSVGGKNGWVK